MISKANSRRWNTLSSVSMYREWNKTAICGGRLGRESTSHCFGSTPAVCRAPCEHQWDQKQWVHSHSRAAGTSQPSFILLIVFPERLAALPSGGPSHGNRHRCTNTVNSNAMFSYFAIVYFCIMQGLAIFRTIDRLFRILTLIWYVRWLKAVRCGFVSYPLERKHKQCTLSFNIIFQTCFL